MLALRYESEKRCIGNKGRYRQSQRARRLLNTFEATIRYPSCGMRTIVDLGDNSGEHQIARATALAISRQGTLERRTLLPSNVN